MFKLKFLKRTDIKIVLILLVLCIIGGLNVFATTYFPEKEVSTFFRNQLFFYLIGTIVFFSLASFNYSFLKKPYLLFSIIVITITLLLLVLVVGDVVYGAKRWISLGFITIQPTEFAKIGILIVSGYFLSKESKDLQTENASKNGKSYSINLIKKHYNMILSLAFYIVVIILTLLQNSLGNTILITLLYLSILFIAKEITPNMLRLLLVLISCVCLSFFIDLFSDSTLSKFVFRLGTFIIALSFVLLNRRRLYSKQTSQKKLLKAENIFILLLFLISLFSTSIISFGYDNLQPYQKVRIESFLHPEKDPNASWNLEQSKIACGSGRISGKGFLNGTQSNYRFLPFSFTDFAYCSFTEQFGFIGSLLLILVFCFLLLTILNWTDRINDKFGRIILYGSVIVVALNLIQHIGMNIGLLPITGVPLPFVSYGGSSTIVSFIALGLAMSVHNSNEMERTVLKKIV